MKDTFQTINTLKTINTLYYENFILLLSQNWLKPPSSDGKEKNPYQFL